MRGTNLLVPVHALHLRDHDIIDIVLAGERRHVLHLLIYHALILHQGVTRTTVPVHAEAIECVFAVGGSQEFRHPLGPLIDAGLVLNSDGAGATRTGLGAVAGARCADFGSDRLFESVDAALGWECKLMRLARGVRRERHTQLSTAAWGVIQDCPILT